MRLTKFGHSCIRLEKDGHVLVIDPGTFTDVPAALDGAEAILVTHEHADHLDPDAVLPILRRNAALELHAPEKVAGQLRSRANSDGEAGVSERIHVIEPGAEATIAGFAVRVFGGQHALIHPHIPVVPNLGYLIDGSLYHPGDSLVVPHQVQVKTLLVPVHAPWSKMGEVLDFVIGVRPEKAHPIHDGLLNETGLAMVEGHITRLGGWYGSTYEHLSVGESREV